MWVSFTKWKGIKKHEISYPGWNLELQTYILQHTAVLSCTTASFSAKIQDLPTQISDQCSSPWQAYSYLGVLIFTGRKQRIKSLCLLTYSLLFLKHSLFIPKHKFRSLGKTKHGVLCCSCNFTVIWLLRHSLPTEELDFNPNAKIRAYKILHIQVRWKYEFVLTVTRVHGWRPSLGPLLD